jgi:hypothetical protein
MTAVRTLFMSLFLALGLGLPLSYSSPAQACAFCGSDMYTIVNVNNWASLRERPSRKANRLAKVPRGDQVIATGTYRDTASAYWLEVFYGGETGWIPAQYLEFSGVFGEPADEPPLQPTDIGPQGYLNATSCGGVVRSRPTMNSRKVASLREGKRIEIMERSGVWMNGYEWFRIGYNNNKVGYQWGGILSADDQRDGSYIGC